MSPIQKVLKRNDFSNLNLIDREAILIDLTRGYLFYDEYDLPTYLRSDSSDYLLSLGKDAFIELFNRLSVVGGDLSNLEKRSECFGLHLKTTFNEKEVLLKLLKLMEIEFGVIDSSLLDTATNASVTTTVFEVEALLEEEVDLAALYNDNMLVFDFNRSFKENYVAFKNIGVRALDLGYEVHDVKDILTCFMENGDSRVSSVLELFSDRTLEFFLKKGLMFLAIEELEEKFGANNKRKLTHSKIFIIMQFMLKGYSNDNPADILDDEEKRTFLIKVAEIPEWRDHVIDELLF